MFLWLHHKMKWMLVALLIMSALLGLRALAMANHRGSDGHEHFEAVEYDEANGHEISGASFKVYWSQGKMSGEDFVVMQLQVDETIQTVVNALSQMVENRTHYRRFDEALRKEILLKVVIEPKVFNRDGKEFMFLVARTRQKGRVNLLINAFALKEKDLVNHPDQLVPVLAREFQWVVSKADTSKKRQILAKPRDLLRAPIQLRKAIKDMVGAVREKKLQELFEDYLRTVDDYNSLKEQPYYDIGSGQPLSADHSDSTTKLYDIRVRRALQEIERNPYFFEYAPKAVLSLLNGKIWNVSFVHINSRDWATRTRVLPKDKAVKVGAHEQFIQPAKILLNLHRKAAPEDPYYSLTNGLPMGALSTEQLAHVVALEIENQIIEKSMRGHVAEDARSATK